MAAKKNNTLDEYREMLKDDGVPMKTKVAMGGAMQADAYEATTEIKTLLEDYMSDTSSRLLIIETKDKGRDEKIKKLQVRSDRNDLISVVLIAISTFFGIKQ